MLPHKVSGVNCFCFTLPIGWEGGKVGGGTEKNGRRNPSKNAHVLILAGCLRGSYADPTRILRGLDCSAGVFDLWVAKA